MLALLQGFKGKVQDIDFCPILYPRYFVPCSELLSNSYLLNDDPLIAAVDKKKGWHLSSGWGLEHPLHLTALTKVSLTTLHCPQCCERDIVGTQHNQKGKRAKGQNDRSAEVLVVNCNSLILICDHCIV